MKLLYLSRSDVEKAQLPMGQIIDALENAFRQKGHGEVEMPPKPGVHPLPDAFIHAMPAFIRGSDYAGVKWVSGYPQNQARKLPYINGLLILNDAQTGIPVCVMDCTWITAARTGAATALAAKYMARPESKSVGILGCGVQGVSNLQGLHEVFNLESVHAYDTVAESAARFAQRMQQQLNLRVRVVDCPQQAVRDMDLVVTAGPVMHHPHATIQKDWVSPGTFVSAVDFDSYWDRSSLRQFDRIITDDRRQFEYYQTLGYFQSFPALTGELEELVCGRQSGRETSSQRTLCVNLGIAMDDMATAPLVYELARAKSLGTELPL